MLVGRGAVYKETTAAFEGGDLAAKYKKLSSEYDDAKDQAAEVHDGKVESVVIATRNRPDELVNTVKVEVRSIIRLVAARRPRCAPWPHCRCRIRR